MGKREPRPKPTAVRLLHGGRKDRINLAEPQPPEGDVTAPDTLTEGAREVWDRLAPDLIARNVLTPWDVDEFVGFCDAVARRDDAIAKLAQHGDVIAAKVFDRSGQLTGHRLVTSPWFQVWKAANDAVLRYGARFSLSPSDRSQINVTSSSGDYGGVERFFSGLSGDE
jgi:P27 family predicted phage terminase small subunit